MYVNVLCIRTVSVVEYKTQPLIRASKWLQKHFDRRRPEESTFLIKSFTHCRWYHPLGVLYYIYVALGEYYK
ncbi:uncharacterized protein YALI1_E28052g [Yarrowia lipolytica]|uniref:Uncharacterized protein n=1 Tax=Yarrowia lipolytica TaxID=4952 RepID=A0A1D8NJQ5_YARLL|nr:hypothetical protein YALI1_E28052g [Yarrowia lipolytica]